MHHTFSDFLRNGGNAQYIFEHRDGRVFGRQSILSFKSSFPNYTAVRADFSARLDAAIAENTRMLLRALTPPDTVPLFTETDLRNVVDVKDEVLSEWDTRLERIFAEYQTHPQRLRTCAQPWKSGCCAPLPGRSISFGRKSWGLRSISGVRKTMPKCATCTPGMTTRCSDGTARQRAAIPAKRITAGAMPNRSRRVRKVTKPSHSLMSGRVEAYHLRTYYVTKRMAGTRLLVMLARATAFC